VSARLFAGLVLCGVAVSIRTALLPLFATKELGASIRELGLFLTAVAAAGGVVELLVGRASDRLPRRNRLIMVAAVWLALGHAALVRAETFTQLMLVATLVYAFTMLPSNQMLAMGFDRAPGNAVYMTTLRAGISLGCLLGPLAAGAISARSDLRTALLFCAVPWLVVAALPLGAPPPPAARSDEPPPRRHVAWVAAFAGAFAVVVVVDVVRNSFLAVYAVEVVGVDVPRAAALYSVTAALNLLLIPLAGRMAARFRVLPVVLVGAALGSVCMALTAVAHTYWQLLAVSAGHAALTSGVMAVGLLLLQEFVPGRAGLGVALAQTASSAAVVIGNLGGALVAGALGWSWMFWLTGALGACGALLLALTAGRLPRRLSTRASTPMPAASRPPARS
jgi:SET family sugar efflux transporter-like MFS transporter